MWDGGGTRQASDSPVTDTNTMLIPPPNVSSLRRIRRLPAVGLLALALSFGALAQNCGGVVQGNVYNVQVVCDGYGIQWTVGGLNGFPGNTQFHYQANVQFKALGTTGFVAKGSWPSPTYTTRSDGSHGGWAYGQGNWVECGLGTYQVDLFAVTNNGNYQTSVETRVVVCG